MIWKKLVKLAVLGTERSTLSPKLKQALEEKGINTSQAPTKILMEAAAFYAPLQRAGWQPTKGEDEPLSLCPAGNEQVCSKKSTQHLQLILYKQPRLLEEFVQGLIANNKCLPYELLPMLFDLSVKNEALWEQLQTVIGARGKWLLPLNPDWKKLQLDHDSANWTIGTKAERVAILKQVRQQNPQEGLALLKSTWEKDSVAEKANLLKELQTGLSLADEPFLEECLDFSRKEVRNAAMKLLVQLPKSQLHQRLQQQLAALITFDKKEDTVIITLPDPDNKALSRDGIKPQKKGTTGAKLAMLAQMIQVVPPDFWVNHLNASPKEVMDLFAQSDPSSSLANALITATALHQSKKWMTTLLDYRLQHYYQKTGEGLVLSPIFEVVPNDLFNQVVHKKLKATATLPAGQSPLLELLQVERQKWSKAVTMLLMTKLKDWMAANDSYSYSGLPYRTLLKQRAAYAIDPALHPEITSFWRVDQKNWAGWGQDVQQFLNILSFRATIAKELQ